MAREGSDRDATERRITELHTKAADQLGSAKAPVRLAGLHALERLANNTIEHQQTIATITNSGWIAIHGIGFRRSLLKSPAPSE
jgi:hypothetical protein